MLHLRINAHASVSLITSVLLCASMSGSSKAHPASYVPVYYLLCLTRFALLRWNLLDRGHSARWSPNLSWFHLKNSGFIPRKAGATLFHGLLKVPEHSQGSARSSKDLSATLPGGCIWLGDHECTASFPSTISIFGIFPTPPLPLLPLWMYCLS